MFTIDKTESTMYTIYLIMFWTWDNKFLNYHGSPYSTREEAEEVAQDLHVDNPHLLITVEEYKHARA